jgi:hypothetical protein
MLQALLGGQSMGSGKRLFVAGACFMSVLAVQRARAAAILYGVDNSTSTLVRINTSTGAATPLFALSGGYVIGDLAWDGAHSVMYASTTNSPRQLITINMNTGSIQVIGAFSQSLELFHGLEYDSNHNVLYGVSTAARGLFRVNTSTAAVTFIGFFAPALNDLAFDQVNDTMYASTGYAPDATQALYTINLASGAVTYKGGFSIAGGVQVGVGLAYDPSLGMFACDNYATATVDDRLYKIDPANAAPTLIGPMNTGSDISLTFAPEPAGAFFSAGMFALVVAPRRRKTSCAR